MASKKISGNRQYSMLSGVLKKRGIERIRFVFTGMDVHTKKMKAFFIEVYVLNPIVSPKRPVLSSEIKGNTTLVPSYVSIIFGAYGEKTHQVAAFYSYQDVKFENTGTFSIGDNFFGDENLKGEISDVNGDASWNLQYENTITYSSKFPSKKLGSKKFIWDLKGSKTVFAGTVKYFGTDYVINTESSHGYIDKYIYPNFFKNWFHLSFNNLSSSINGKKLSNTSFSIQKINENSYTIVSSFEGKQFVLNTSSSLHKKSIACKCVETHDDVKGAMLHWSISVRYRKMIIDIDAFCSIADMSLRAFDNVDGRSNTKLYCGATGTGEIKFYKHVKKYLEPVEDAHIANVICEYGK